MGVGQQGGVVGYEHVGGVSVIQKGVSVGQPMGVVLVLE